MKSFFSHIELYAPIFELENEKPQTTVVTEY